MHLRSPLRLALASVLALASLVGARMFSQQPAAPQPGAPVLVELFTSEGCSDCPPADELLNAMARGQAMNFNVIPLAFHVTYWNQDGWHDRFSDNRYTERQQDYQALFHTRSIYTPQLVVDGEYETVGNSPGKVFALIRRAAGAAKPAGITLAPAADSVEVQVRGAAGGSGKVWLAITEDDLSTEVKAGENKAKTLHHYAVVRQLDSIGKTGKDGSFTRTVSLKLKNDWQRDKLHLVAFVQDGSGHVLGAATAPLGTTTAANGR
ncbi:MAG TPA: DUF1223 domain-containing protein [Terriglobales bacterium]|nr:DUF1223 domain-containing protein [Terriglobales bacterium]